MNTITKRAAVFTIAIATVAAAASPSFARTQRHHSDAVSPTTVRHVQRAAASGWMPAEGYGGQLETNIYQCKIDDGYGRWSDCESGQSG
jgi:hypothetical protein